MIPRVIGLDIEDAQAALETAGYAVRLCEYVSLRGIPDADATKVIRQRGVGNNTIELTVSHFKTQVEENPQR